MSDIQAWLDKGREIESKATDGPWGGTWNGAREGNIGGETDVLNATNVSARDLYFITEARTRLPQALAALQAVLDMHQPTTTYEPAGEWDCEGKYIPYCVHGDEPDHPDHKMIDGWWQCTTNPEQVCNEATEGDPQPWPCPTVRAIQDAIGDE